VSGVAAYGALSSFPAVPQGLRAWATLFRACGAWVIDSNESWMPRLNLCPDTCNFLCRPSRGSHRCCSLTHRLRGGLTSGRAFRRLESIG
jgi:hypothetical protein